MLVERVGPQRGSDWATDVGELDRDVVEGAIGRDERHQLTAGVQRLEVGPQLLIAGFGAAAQGKDEQR